jgi:hypothetical protein
VAGLACPARQATATVNRLTVVGGVIYPPRLMSINRLNMRKFGFKFKIKFKKHFLILENLSHGGQKNKQPDTLRGSRSSRRRMITDN